MCIVGVGQECVAQSSVLVVFLLSPAVAASGGQTVPCPAPLYSYDPWLTVWLEDLSQHYQTFLTLHSLPAGSIIVWSGLISGLVW